jgi:hypothetical protein
VPVITSPTTVYGSEYYPFNYQIAATNDPTGFQITSGALPYGLFLNTSTGIIFGYPAGPGTYNFTIAASNGAGAGSANVTYTLLYGNPIPLITSATVASGNVDVPFSFPGDRAAPGPQH